MDALLIVFAVVALIFSWPIGLAVVAALLI